MKRLFLLRHAKAEAAASGQDDRDRALSPRGIADAAAMGRYLHGSPAPDIMLVSPSLRTVQTSDLLRREVAWQNVPQICEPLYLARPGQILGLLQAQPDAARQVMVVGHNPGLEELAALLARERIGKTKPGREKFPTCALAVLDFTIAHWRDVRPGEGALTDFVSPKDL